MRNAMLLTGLLSAGFGTVHATQAVAADAAACAVALPRCAEETLRAQLAPAFEKVELRAQAADLSLRAGESVRVRPVPWAGLPARRMTVWMDVVSRGRVTRAKPVEVEVHAYVTGWAATSDVRPGATSLNEAGLRPTLVDVTTLGAAPWREALDGHRLRKPLLAGQTLTVAHVEPVTAVTRGQLVDVTAGSGDLRIDAPARALQDGQVGDLIQVRLARAAAAVTGRVTGTGVVEVMW